MATLSDYIAFLRANNANKEADFWANDMVYSICASYDMSTEQVLALSTEEIMVKVYDKINEKLGELQSNLDKLSVQGQRGKKHVI